MRSIFRYLFLGTAAAAILTSCTTAPTASKTYHVTAYKPNDSSKVRVKVSLSKQNIYVLEGDRLLMAVACSVGIPEKPTPKGNFTIYPSRKRNAPAPMVSACRAIMLFRRTLARTFPVAMSDIRWVSGVNSRPLTDFIRASFIPIRAHTAAFVCTVKPRRNFSRSCTTARR